MLQVLGIKNADALIPTEMEQKPRDPVSENMSFLTGKPTKAFIYQDHKAHIATHMSLIQDPMIMQMIGQSPMGQQMMSAVMAHIAEHMAFEYRNQIEQQLGVQMTAPDAELDEQTEVQISRLVAQAAQQLLQSNQQQAQQAQAQEMAQNPQLQMQQAELQLKAQELQRKEADSQRDFAIAQEKIRLERERLAVETQKEQLRLQAQQRNSDKQMRADMLKTVLKPRPNKPIPKQ